MAIITISRGSLIGGRAVAECLASRLGSPHMAAEILRRAAGKLGASVEVVREKFEAPPGLWERLSRERERYVLAVKTALLEACLEGSLVYHGLAGQFLLQGVPGVLRVRLIAPVEMRIRALTERHRPMSRREAADFIGNVDQQRRRRVRLMYGLDVEDPSLYDLTVNLRTLSPEGACAAIAEAAAQPQYAITPHVTARMESLARECRRRLEAEP